MGERQFNVHWEEVETHRHRAIFACIAAVTVALGGERSTAVSVSVRCHGTGGCWGPPAEVTVGLRRYASNVGGG